jgi:hypothetical protein
VVEHAIYPMLFHPTPEDMQLRLLIVIGVVAKGG